MDRTLRRHFAAASLALALLLVADAAHAVTWTHLVGGDASGNWNTGGNWAGSVIPDGQDAVADFTTLNITTDSTVTLDTASRTVGTLRFGDATTASNDWTLNSSGGAALTLDVSAGQPVIEVVNRTCTLDTALAGTQGFEKTGAGTLLVNTAQAYTGDTTLSGGTTTLGTSNALSAADTLALNNGAVLDLQGHNQAIDDLDLNDGVINGTGTLLLSSRSILTKGVINAVLGGHIATGALGDGRLEIGGDASATVELNGNNTFTTASGWGVLIGHGPGAPGGTVKLGHPHALANRPTSLYSGTLDLNGQANVAAPSMRLLGGSAKIVNNDAGNPASTDATVTVRSTTCNDIGGPGDLTLKMVVDYNATTPSDLDKIGAGKLTLTGNNTYSGVTTIEDGTLSVATLANGGVASGVGDSSSASANLVIQGATLQYTGATVASDRGFTLDGGGTLDVTNAAAELEFSGVVTGTGGLSKEGPGTLTLSNSANDYTGITTIDGGTLKLGASSALSTGQLVLNNGAVLDLQGHNQTIDDLDLNDGVINGTGTLSLSSRSYLTKGVINANLGGSLGTGSLDRIEVGGDPSATVELNGNNTFTTGSWGVLVGHFATAGTVKLGHVHALGDTARTSFYSGTLDLNGLSGVQVNYIMLRSHRASLVNSNTASAASTGAVVSLRSGTTGVPSTYSSIGGPGDLTLSGRLESPYAADGFHKVGAGTLTLTGNSTYTGETLVDQGTLLVDGSIASSSSAIVAAGATLGGSGQVPGVSGAGLVSPGASPGILTAPSVDPTSALRFAFEFTATGSPAYGSPSASINDVLRLTDLSEPFAAPLGPGNDVGVYFDLDPLECGDLFRGGFYTDADVDLLAAIGDASFHYYVRGDGFGTHLFNGVHYYTLGELAPWLDMRVSTVPETANFGAGDVNGLVTQFTVVPEPTTLALLGLAGFGLLGRRRRNGGS